MSTRRPFQTLGHSYLLDANDLSTRELVDRLSQALMNFVENERTLGKVEKLCVFVSIGLQKLFRNSHTSATPITPSSQAIRRPLIPKRT